MNCLLLSFFQFLADLVVLLFIQLIVLLVKNIRQNHTGSRHDGHEQKKFHDFSMGGTVHHIADGGKFVRFRDQIPGGLVLQIRDLIGITRDSKDDV